MQRVVQSSFFNAKKYLATVRDSCLDGLRYVCAMSLFVKLITHFASNQIEQI